MYDTLIDELRQDAGGNPEETISLAEKAVETVVSGEDEAEADASAAGSQAAAGGTSGDEEQENDSSRAAGDEVESWSDDPVRMYLTQMGEIPLLTRQEEIELAKRIETTRADFRRTLLECDYVIQVAYSVLKRVHHGELPFDRTVQVSVTDRLEKDQILGRLPHNIASLDVLLKQNRRDYRLSLSKRSKANARRSAWKRLGRRRRRAVRLVEELGLRTQRIESMIDTLAEFSRRVDELSQQVKAEKKSKRVCPEIEKAKSEIRHILWATQETPQSLRNRVRRLRRVYAKYQKAKRGLSEVPKETFRILLRIRNLLWCLFNAIITAYYADLPALRRICSPTNLIPFPLYGSGLRKPLILAAT